MAYKFQSGHAIMSGTLDQEGNLAVLDGAGAIQASLGEDGEISGSGKFELGGTVQLDGVLDNAMVIADSIYYFDATDDKMKKDLASDVRNLFFSAVSTDATIAAGGVLTIAADAITSAKIATGAVIADGIAAGAVGTAALADDAVDADKLASSAVVNASVAANAGIDFSKLAALSSAQLLVGNGSNVATAVAASGDVTLANTGAFTIVNDAVTSAKIADNAITNALMADDSVGAAELIDDSVGAAAMADNAVGTAVIVDNAVTLAKMAGITRGSIISGDASGDPAALAVGTAHQFLQSDGTDLAYVTMSGDATLAAGVLSIGNDKVTGAMLAPAVAGVGLAQDGSGNLDLDLNELVADTLASGDFFPFVDSTDNGSQKITIDNLALFMAGGAGTGITATNGVLSVSAAQGVNALGDEDATLLEAFNVATVSITDNRTLTLPASNTLAAGDTVTVKIQGLSANKKVTIARAGSQTIDGGTSVVLESPGAAVSLKYVALNTFAIF